MKNLLYASTAFLAGTIALSSCSDKTLKLENNIDSISYAQGLIVGSQYKKLLESEKMNGNKEAFKEAFQLGFSDDSSQFIMTREEAFDIIQSYNQRLSDEAQRKMEAQMKEQRAFNKVNSDKFIAQYKEEKGVIAPESGIMYKVLKEGYGPKPTAKDTVVVHYEGKLIDGKVFVSSYKRGETLKFALSDASLKGWKLALQDMPKGSAWEVVLPSELAYGEVGAGDVVPGNSAVKFKIELVNVINPRR